MSSSKRSVLIICIFVHTILQTNGLDKYTDENRPYEFGFTIEGEQHRHEKKDENGIIMGEFGFITADGVYHVTVYATDEQGRFKILSMKNIRVKPYPTFTQNSRTGHSLSLSGPEKNLPALSSTMKNPAIEANKQSQTHTLSHNNQQSSKIPHSQLPPRQPASPVKSCSHCSLPTTTTPTPLLPQVFGLQTNQGNKEISNPYGTNQNIYDSNQNYQNNQKPYNDGNIASPAGGDVPSNTENNNDQGKAQQSILGTPGLDNYSRGITQQNNYDIPQINDANQFYNNENNQQKYHPSVDVNNPNAENTYANVSPNYNSEVSNNNEQNNQQSIYNAYEYNQNQGMKGFSLTGSNQNSANMQQGSSNAPLSNPYTGNVDNANQSNVLGNRSPKKYDSSSENVEPYNSNVDAASRNLLGTSANSGPKKPMLVSAQMQVVDKNTDIYYKKPGESDGLPEGVTKDYMERVLYVFNYTVGFHGHFEKGYENGAKQGYYYVTGRNGVKTRVDYEADEKGFRPKISQGVLDILSDEVPKAETEKEQKYGLRSYEFKWLYFPVEPKQQQQ